MFLLSCMLVYQTNAYHISDLSFSFQSCFIYKVRRTKTKNGYRQLGLIGNSVNTQSHADCRQIFWSPVGDGNPYHECMMANDKLNHQNIIQLATEVLKLRKR